MNHFEKQATAAFLVKSGGTSDTNFGGSDYAMYAANPVAGAVNQAAKGGWDRDAWYSWVPLVGDAGNAVSNFKDGNYWSGALDLGLGALNIATLGAGGLLAKAGLKGGAKLLGNIAKKAPGTTMGNVAKQTSGAALNTVRAGNQAANSLRTGVQNLANSGGLKGLAGKGLQKVPGGLYNFGKRSPILTLGGLAANPLFSGGSNGVQAPMQGGGFQMPNLNFGGMGQGAQGGGGLNLSKGRMQGYEQGRIGGL